MSLQVWLPLVKDCTNQGLSDLTFNTHNTNYRYIRFVINAIRDSGRQYYTQLSILRFLDANGNIYPYPSGTTVTTSLSGYASSESPACIIDGNTGTKFCSPWSAGGYLTIDLGASGGIDINKYSRFQWYTANDGDWRDPVSFDLYFSTDGSNFIKTFSVTNASITTSRQTLAYTGTCWTPLLSSGKIGQGCYYNSSNSIGGLISDKKLHSVGNNVSMFAWVKFDNFAENPTGIGGTHTIVGDGYPAATGMGFNIIQNPSNTSARVVSVNTGTGSGRTWQNYYGNTVISASTWYHIGFTYDGSQIKIYVNGTLDATHNYSGQSNPADYVHIASWARDGLLSTPTIFPHYKTVGRINDFRIYDHVLSKKEIKYLSQGLVAHYQLKGMGRTNYLKGSGQFTEQNPLIRNANDVSHMNDSYIYHTNVLTATITAGGSYTLSVKCDGNPTSHPTSGTTGSQRLCSLWLQNQGTGNHYHFALSSGADGRLYGTVNLPAGTYVMRTNLYAADKVNYTIKFWDMKLVFGEYEPNDIWCPNEEDELYSTLSLGNGNEADVSGYGNDGTKVGVFMTSPSPHRYSSCYRFNGSNYINCGRGAMVRDAITVSCWAYMDNWGAFSSQRILSCTESGGWNFEPNGDNSNYLAFAMGTGEIACTYKTVVSDVALSSLGGWHMITGTYDGYTTRIYVDGALRGTNTAYSSKVPIFYNASNSIFLGAEAAGSATTPAGNYFTGNISDVRIYATALSDSDILDLYKNSASLSKDGVLFAYDFNENKQNTINKNGIVATGGFNDKEIPTYDMKIKALDDGSTWTRIHHLDVSNDKTFFANASEVAKCTDKHNRYSRMGDVNKYGVKLVPSEYTQLEYLKSSGTQYIDTGFKPNSNTRIVIKAKLETPHSIYGVTQSGTMFNMTGGGSGMYYYWGNGGQSKITNYFNQIHTYGQDKNVCYVDGAVYHTYTASTWSATCNMFLFGRNSGSALNDAGTVSIYNCQIYDNGLLIRNYIPCKNASGTLGMYDTVEKKFYTNAGSGTFTAGGNADNANAYEYEFMLTYPSMKKSVPQGYTELEYIESTGTQFIRTGVYGYSDGTYVRGHKWEFDIEFKNNGIRQLMGYGPNGGEYWGVRANGNYERGGSNIDVVSGKRATIVHDYSKGTQGNNSLWVDYVTNVGSTNLTTTQEYTLFNLTWGTNDQSDKGYYCYAKLYRCKCIQGNTVIRDFIPAMRNSDGVIGLIDVVNNVFYTNAGTGHFVCNYSYLSYIESTGTQYINTGVSPTSTTEVEISFTPTGGLTENSIFGSSWSASGYFLMLYQNKIRWHSGGTAVDIGSYNEGDKIVCRCANTYIIVNGIKYNIAGGTNSTDAIMLLGDMNYSASKRGIGKVEYMKIWNNGSIVRDFVPCNYGGTIGMLDKVGGSFYGNVDTGTFKYSNKGGSYQWLDYIQNTGVEYINTGYPAPEGFISEAVLEYVTKNGGYVLGSHNISEPYGRNGYGINGNGYWEVGTGDTCPASSSQVALNTRYTVKMSSVKGDSYMDVNGTRVISTTDSSSRCTDNVWVFYNQYNKHYNHTVSQIKLYSLKFWLPNGTLIRDYVPCISPSGKVGLYDKVTKRFFGNSGSGYLIAGTTKESLPLYNRWIQTSCTTDVNQGDNIPFKPISTTWTDHFGAIKPAQSADTAYDCDVVGTGNWYAPIGQYNIWSGGIPAADGSAQTKTELWVRTDRFSNEDQLNIYNGSITAKDYIEI